MSCNNKDNEKLCANHRQWFSRAVFWKYCCSYSQQLAHSHLHCEPWSAVTESPSYFMALSYQEIFLLPDLVNFATILCTAVHCIFIAEHIQYRNMIIFYTCILCFTFWIFSTSSQQCQERCIFCESLPHYHNLLGVILPSPVVYSYTRETAPTFFSLF